MNRGLLMKKINNQVMELMRKLVHMFLIHYGGYLVIGGTQESLDSLLKTLPPVKHYPYQLPYHGAYHTPLLKEISKKQKIVK